MKTILEMSALDTRRVVKTTKHLSKTTLNTIISTSLTFREISFSGLEELLLCLLLYILFFAHHPRHVGNLVVGVELDTPHSLGVRARFWLAYITLRVDLIAGQYLNPADIQIRDVETFCRR